MRKLVYANRCIAIRVQGLSPNSLLFLRPLQAGQAFDPYRGFLLAAALDGGYQDPPLASGLKEGRRCDRPIQAGSPRRPLATPLRGPVRSPQIPGACCSLAAGARSPEPGNPGIAPSTLQAPKGTSK